MKDSNALRLKYLRFMALYSILMLCVIVLVTFEKKDSAVIQTEETTVLTDTAVETQYVYVRPEEISTDETTQEPTFWVKEYNGYVGIFSLDGSLYKIIDTKVISLPEADQALLEEGFEIVGRSQLNSIIEDYSE